MGIHYDVEVIETSSSNLKINVYEGIPNQIYNFVIKDPLDRYHKLQIKLTTAKTPYLSSSLNASIPLSSGLNTISLNRDSL